MFVLREVAKKLGVSSMEIAEKTGISKKTIDEYRTRRKMPSLVNGLKIADALGIDPHDLIVYDEQMERDKGE